MATTPIDPQKRADIFLIRGDTASITFSIPDVDLTDATVFFTAKPALTADADDASAVIEKEVISHTDPEAGETVIELTSEDTDVTPGTYFYDIQVKKSDDTIVSIPVRKLVVVADVTRRTA